MWSTVLVDSCVMMDAFMPFREDHDKARHLFSLLARRRTHCLIPSHAYFEYVTTLLVHYKREPEKLSRPFPDLPFSGPTVEVVSLTNDYVLNLLAELQSSPFPDLKSQDMIFFCIARNRKVTLLTNDRKLRNASRKLSVSAFNVEESITELNQTQ